jgi:biotin carboxyl carrier protein
MKFETLINGSETALDIDAEKKLAHVGEREIPYELKGLGDGRFLLRTGNTTHVLDNILVKDAIVEFTINGKWVKSEIKDEQSLLLASLGFKVGGNKSEGKLNAPMPGKILNIMVKEGEIIKIGEPVIILEAMKMENELKAPMGGVVSKISAEVGQSVEKNHVILEIVPVG